MRLHVAAKRYLSASEAGYFDVLSEASKLSLRLQGGPMNAEEQAKFEPSDASRMRWRCAAGTTKARYSA